MIQLRINLENKNVLIVGSGNTAFRKIKQLLLEKANIIVVSLNPIEVEGIQYIHDSYDKKYLKDIFYCIACTNDLELNKTICDDCNDLNILVSSMTSVHANAHMTKSLSYKTLNIGFDTNGLYPSYNKVYEEEFNKIAHKHEYKVQLLSQLRKYFLKKDALKQLIDLKESTLEYLIECFNGDIFPIYMLQDYKEIPTDFIKPKGLIVSLKESDFEDFNKLYLILKQMDFIIPIQPLVLHHGFIYNKITKMYDYPFLDPIINNLEDLDQILSCYDCDNACIITHPRKTRERYPLDTYDFDSIKEANLTKYHTMIPLMLLEGNHYEKDVKPYFNHIQPVLMKNEKFIKYLEKKNRG